MNGRCTADPLDHADDICEFCGDEFCRSCLIQTRGGKGQQICRDCAIRNSGIKGTKSTKTRPTKAQLQKARKALAEAKGTRNAKTFEFFDEVADYVPRHSNDEPSEVLEAPAEAEKGRGTKRRFGLRRKDDETSIDGFATADHDSSSDDSSRDDSASDDHAVEHDAVEHDAPPPLVPTGRSTPATTLIESGALAASASGSQTTRPAETPQPSTGADPGYGEPAAARTPLDRAGVDAEVFQHRAADDWTDAHAPAGTQAPGSLADRLRDRPLPTAPVTPSFASPTQPGDLNPAQSPVDEMPFHASLDADPFAIADHHSTSAPATSLDVAFPTATPAQVTPPVSSFDWQSAPSSENLTDDPFGENDPFAETVDVATAPVAAVAPTAPTPESPTRLAAPAPQHVPGTTAPSAIPQPAAAAPSQPGPGTAPVSAPAANAAAVAGAADTDANGNWIPPLLRGMAPVAERRAAPLPKRRNSD